MAQSAAAAAPGYRGAPPAHHPQGQDLRLADGAFLSPGRGDASVATAVDSSVHSPGTISPGSSCARRLALSPRVSSCGSPPSPRFSFPAMFSYDGITTPADSPHGERLPGSGSKTFGAKSSVQGPAHWLRGLCCASRLHSVALVAFACLALALAGALGWFMLPAKQTSKRPGDPPGTLYGHLRPPTADGATPGGGTSAPQTPSPPRTTMASTGWAGLLPTTTKPPQIDPAVHSGGVRARPAASAPAPAPSSWLMCPGPQSCGDRTLRRWRTGPAALAATVGNFSQLPGVPQDAFEAVATRWATQPPPFHGAPVQLADVAAFARQLLTSDPFGTGDAVPYVDFGSRTGGQVVAVTQRQLAFVVANVLMGNDLADGEGNGLSAALKRCAAKTPKPTGYLYSLLSLLAVLSKELAPGQHGTMLIAATPMPQNDNWKAQLSNHTLVAPTICSDTANAPQCNLADFMAGGTPFQAMTDIAGSFVGGGAELCDLANSQDESAVQFYSEALAFAFFVKGESMLPVPWALLGARRYLHAFSGETSNGPPNFARCGVVDGSAWLNQEITKAVAQVHLGDQSVTVAASAFVAAASECSSCIAGTACTHVDLINNNCDSQRRHLDLDISRWYQAYEPTMYNPAVQDALGQVVRRIGTGPWGAGVWWGDSQQYFLAVWLATSLLRGATLDYYVYDHFCENPGNQCFLLGAQGCAACFARSQADPAMLASRCGGQSLHDMVARFNGQKASALHDALLAVGKPPLQVFDALVGATIFQ